MNKQPEVTAQTRANLRQAFWELYCDRPIEKITVRAITDRAGYNRATFYLYFHDVYDLFNQIEDGILADIRTLIQEGLLQEDTLDLSHHMGRIMLLAERYDAYMPQLMGPHGDPAFAQQLKAILSPLIDRFILADATLAPEERDILREFYASGLLAAINAWTTASPRMPIDHFIGLVVNSLL